MASARSTSWLRISQIIRELADISDSVNLARKADLDFQDAGFGGTADIYRGTYWQKDGGRIEVAVKCIRPNEFIGREDEYKQKIKKKLARELEIWRTVSDGANILRLLGVINGVGPLPSAVSPYCAWNLKDYLERPSPPPKHIKMMTDTLQGLSYMHELKPNPIAHGDLKSHNILVTEDERALICDFGRSRYPTDQPREDSNSSPFGATIRYMSPELFIQTVIGPTPASDMWAYGCVALEILCRVQPYQMAKNDFEVIQLIREGSAPSERPRGLRGVLLNDTLWSTLASCWLDQGWRPTSRSFLEGLTEMLRNGQLSYSPLPWNFFTSNLTEVSEIPPAWPDGLQELGTMITINKETGVLASSTRSKLWIGTLQSRWRERKKVVIKVPRLNVHPQNQEPHIHLQHIFRKRVADRYLIKHQNIVNILGIDSTQPEHPGLVLEYCEFGSLSSYFTRNPNSDGWVHVEPYESRHPKPRKANRFSLMWDILEGLRYMHSFPIPVPQGDLTPDNIMVTGENKAKINLFSFGRMVSAIPAAATLSGSGGALIPFRWLSPELLLDDSQPTTESDMWSMGCVGCWILTGLRPYAGHLRDDFAGLENVRGIPPADISKIDLANEIGDSHAHAVREEPWITNGLWNTITRCWTVDPLRRPTAKGFLGVLRSLEGRKYDWLPLDVADLAGKVAVVSTDSRDDDDGERIRVGRYKTVWMRDRPGRTSSVFEVDMLLLRTTYTPNWYTKPFKVVVKHEFRYPEETSIRDKRGYIPSVRHEIAITSQLDHPNVIKLLGIDTSHDSEIPKMVFENISDTTLNNYLYKGGNFKDSLRYLNDVAAGLAYLHEHPNGMIVYNHINTMTIFITDEGHAKLTNFTRAFQYATQPTQIPAPISTIAAGPRVSSIWSSPEFIREPDLMEHIPVPTAAGDMWALGILILFLFVKDHPRTGNPGQKYFEQIREGHVAGPALCDEPECANMDIRLLSLARSLLREDPGARPLAKSASRMVSQLL